MLKGGTEKDKRERISSNEYLRENKGSSEKFRRTSQINAKRNLLNMDPHSAYGSPVLKKSHFYIKIKQQR